MFIDAQIPLRACKEYPIPCEEEKIVRNSQIKLFEFC